MRSPILASTLTAGPSVGRYVPATGSSWAAMILFLWKVEAKKLEVEARTSRASTSGTVRHLTRGTK